MASLIEINDALVDDVETNVALPAHRTHKYVKPGALRGDLAPWLCVHPVRITPTIEATPSSYENFYRYEVCWAVAAMIAGESNFDESIAKGALQTAAGILDRLWTYGDGVPGLFNITASVEDVKFDVVGGTVWQMTALLYVEVFD